MDTANGLYQTNIYEASPIYPNDSSGNPVYKSSKIAYLSDSLKNTKRIYISNLERDLLTNAVKQKIESSHKGHLTEPIDDSIIFFVFVPLSLHRASKK